MRHLGDSDASAASTRESLDGHDLEVVRVAKAVLGPVSKVVSSGDGTRSTLGLANGPVLLEGGSTSDGRLVGAGVGADSVSSAIAGERAKLGDTRLTSTAGIVRAVGLDDVVLGLGRVDPAVDGEVGAAAGLVVGGVGDGAGSAGLPADADDEVAADALSPVHGVGAGVHIAGELTEVAVVVLDVVDAAGTGTLDLLLLCQQDGV